MQELILFFSQHLALSSAFICILLSLLIVEWLRAKHMTFCITSLAVTQLINHEEALVIDLRSHEHYCAGHIIHALSVPIDQLSKQRMERFEKFRARPIVFVCATGMDSKKIAAMFIKQGYNAYALSNGMRTWNAADMPVTKLANNPLHPLEKKDRSINNVLK